MKMTTTKTTQQPQQPQQPQQHDNDDNDDNDDGTRRRGALTPLPFWFLFFPFFCLFSLLTSCFLFYSYNINDNMPEVMDDTPFIWGL
jgi:hypothetical protein